MTLPLQIMYSCVSVQTSHLLNDILYSSWKPSSYVRLRSRRCSAFLSWTVYFIDIVLSLDYQSNILAHVVYPYSTAAPVPLSKNIELVSVSRYSTALLLGMVFRPNPVRPGPG